MPKPNGARIRLWREERGLTTAELAARVGFTNQGSMRNIENSNDPTSRLKLYRIARELGVSVDEIVLTDSVPCQPDLRLVDAKPSTTYERASYEQRHGDRVVPTGTAAAGGGAGMKNPIVSYYIEIPPDCDIYYEFDSGRVEMTFGSVPISCTVMFEPEALTRIMEIGAEALVGLAAKRSNGANEPAPTVET